LGFQNLRAGSQRTELPQRRAAKEQVMSGPKSGSYQVVSAAELARREQERVRNLAKVTRLQFESALKSARAEMRNTKGLQFPLPVQPGWPGDSADVEVLRRYVDELLQRQTQMQEDRASAHRSRRTAIVSQGLRSSKVHRVSTADDVLGERTTAEAEHAVTQEEHATRLLGRMRDDVAAVDRTRVEATAARLKEAQGHDQQRGLLDQLRRRVDVANQRAAQLDEDVARARYLLADLRSTPDPPADLDAALVAVMARETTLEEQVLARVKALVAAARAAADAAYVTASVADALQVLGYEVDVGFRTALGQTGVAHARGTGDGWDDHGVRIRLDRQRGVLTFHLVRADDRVADAQSDTTLETTWCEDVPRLVEELQVRGVQMVITSRVLAGTVPVASVPREKLGSQQAGSGRRGRARRQQRQLKERRR
jgi:hypothetical protein